MTWSKSEAKASQLFHMELEVYTSYLYWVCQFSTIKRQSPAHSDISLIIAENLWRANTDLAWLEFCVIHVIFQGQKEGKVCQKDCNEAFMCAVWCWTDKWFIWACFLRTITGHGIKQFAWIQRSLNLNLNFCQTAVRVLSPIVWCNLSLKTQNVPSQ